jgi:endonuclease-8
MPEGPEIHRAANRIAKALVGKTLTDVEFHYKTVEGLEHFFLDKKVEYVKARSKGLLISVGDYVMYSHNQLYGRWTVNRSTTKPKPTNRSLRVLFGNEKNTARLWSATDIEIFEPWELPGHPYLAKLGPDVADLAVQYDDVFAQISNPKFARRQLSGLMLDQGFLAGVGNYLRSEILFDAGISPYRKTGSLSEEECHQLAKSAIEITALAYHETGVTGPQELYQTLRDNGLSRYQARHYVFTRDGLACHACDSLIVHTRLSGRRLDYCPKCQI